MPWLYEVYRPFLFSHLIFDNDELSQAKIDDKTYRSFSFEVYGLSDQ